MAQYVLIPAIIAIAKKVMLYRWWINMKCITRLIFIDDNNEKFFGEGPFRLLKLIDETGRYAFC